MDILSKADYLRVTEALDMFTNFSMVHPDILEYAQRRGTEVHLSCDTIMVTEEMCHQTEQEKAEWLEEIKKKSNPLAEYKWKADAVSTEQLKSFELWAAGKRFPYALRKIPRLFDDDLMITGEIDGVYIHESGQGLVLFDTKTAETESRTWRLQLSAYAYMLRKNGYDIRRIESVKLHRQGKYPKVYPYLENMPMFIKALELRNYFKEKKSMEDK